MADNEKSIKCPKCGKVFTKPVENVYKLKIGGKLKHYCSYSCWRKAGGGKNWK